MHLKIVIFYICLFTRLARSFSFSVTPSPVGVNQAYEISWEYNEGDSPDGSFAIEVQGEGGFVRWIGLYNSSGSTSAVGPPSAGTYTLAAYSNDPVADNGTFSTTVFIVQDQAGPMSSSSSSISTTTVAVSPTKSTSTSTSSTTGVTTSSQTTNPPSSISEPSSSHSTITSASPSPSDPASSGSTGSTSSTTKSFAPTSSSTKTPSSSSSHLISAKPTLGSSIPSSLSSKTTKSTSISIGVSSGAGALLLFILLGVYVRVRRQRNIQHTQKEKITPTPYEFAHISQRSNNLPRRLSDALNGIANHIPLNQDAREMQVMYELESEPPSYESTEAEQAVAGEAF